MNFHPSPLLFVSPLFSFFSYPSNPGSVHGDHTAILLHIMLYRVVALHSLTVVSVLNPCKCWSRLGAVASWLVRSPLDRATRVGDLARGIVLFEFAPTVRLSTQVCK